MLAMGYLATAVLAVAGALCGVSAEPPLTGGYQYQVPNNIATDLGGSTIVSSAPNNAAVINNGIGGNTIITNSGGYPGQGSYTGTGSYTGPSLTTGNNQILENYPGRYSNDYQDAEVHKHVYVHVAPDEPADRLAPLVVQARKPKKHYKIVFIKTPTVLPPAASIVNLPQPDQEKTLIYVLSKKPDLQQSLVLSTPAPTQPAKPEVFFIRYKSNEAQPQQQIVYQNGQGVNNGVITNVNGIKTPVNSYGVPLAAPLGPNSLYVQQGQQSQQVSSVVSASTPAPGTFNTV